MANGKTKDIQDLHPIRALFVFVCYWKKIY